jgi:hypothetical protein
MIDLKEKVTIPGFQGTVEELMRLVTNETHLSVTLDSTTTQKLFDLSQKTGKTKAKLAREILQQHFDGV